MLLKQQLLRASAASAVAALVGLGAFVPAHATGDGDDSGADATSRDDSASAGTKGHSDFGQSQGKDGAAAATANNSNGDGHTPTEICHRTGPQDAPKRYIRITVDDNAWKAHEAHGDFLWEDGMDPECDLTQEEIEAAQAAGGTSPDGTRPDGTGSDRTRSGRGTSADEVLGVEAGRARAVAAEAAAAGQQTQTDAAVNRPAVAGTADTEDAEVTGILPATGAGDYTVPVLVGAGLLAAGAALMAQRRLRSR